MSATIVGHYNLPRVVAMSLAQPDYRFRTLRLHARMEPMLVAAVVLAALHAAARGDAPAVEAKAVAPSEGVLAAGSRWETPYFVRDDGQPGPTVLVVGGVHGNETAGTLAADQIRHWRITRGKLVVLPRANAPALAARSRNTPGVKAALGNLNRNFPTASEGGPSRGELATHLWEFVRRNKPDWLVDLHEGFGVHRQNRDTVGSTVLVHSSGEPAADAAVRMVEVVNATIDDPEKRFMRLRSTKDEGYLAQAAGAHLGAEALIVETTMRGQPLSTRTRQHRMMVHRFLADLDMLDSTASADVLVAPERAPGQVAVAIYDAGGTGGQGVPNLARLLVGDGFAVAHVGPPEIRDDVLSQFDVVIFPGGTGSGQAKALGDEGRAAVRRFVRSGGGYVGICAGAYLATCKFSWGLGLLDAQTVSPKWNRGGGTVRIELTEAGAAVLGPVDRVLDVRYHSGPILMPAQDDAVPDYVVWAWFRTEVAKNGTPPGIMVHSPAVAAGRYGSGRVVCLSPHAEGGPHKAIVLRAVRWAAGRP